MIYGKALYPHHSVIDRHTYSLDEPGTDVESDVSYLGYYQSFLRDRWSQ